MSSEPMDEITQGKVQANIDRYQKALGELNTAVKMLSNYFTLDLSPASLRTGVNGAMIEHSGLVRTLIKKGIISEEEYTAELANEMEREVERYKKKLAEYFPEGINIDLI